MCWPTEDWAEQVTADSLQSPLTQGKRSQMLTLEMVWGPDLTHTTCISPGHPTVDGQLIPARGKELVRERGVTFHFLKS